MTAKERRQNRIMDKVMDGSEEYYRNHPEVAKVMEDENRQQKERADQWEIEHYGTATYERDSRDIKYQKIKAVPVEIEVPRELDNLVKMDILQELEISYSEWVERCYRERMKQILTDPAEFGKLVLPSVMRGHLVDSILDEL